MNEPNKSLNAVEEAGHRHDEETAPQAARRLDLPGVRALLEKSHGREYWRSLEDLAQTDAFQDLIHREFPRYASEWEDGDSRRNFIKLMGASLALAGLTARVGIGPPWYCGAASTKIGLALAATGLARVMLPVEP